MKKDIARNYIPRNSRMTENFDEMKELGKQMEHLKTNTELEEATKVPDPIQEKEVARTGAFVSKRNK